MVHIGNLIQQELDRQHLTRTWLADAIYCSRPNINKIIGRAHINTDSLLLICHALRHNFFADMAADYETGKQREDSADT